jgi:hypothetical protein
VIIPVTILVLIITGIEGCYLGGLGFPSFWIRGDMDILTLNM